MLNKKQNLNKDIFSKEVERESTREGYGRGLLEIGKKNKNIVALSADLTHSTYTHFFADEFPERFFQVGVAEQNMASVASGMSAMGKIPFIASYSIFNPGRNWKQIRTTICYNNSNVKIIGSHSGVTVGADGGSHQALEDIALTRVLPRMTVIYPCDAIEAKKATIESAKIDSPVYIRLDRSKTPIMTTEKTEFKIGKAQVFFESKNWKKERKENRVGIIVSGPLLYEVLLSAKELDEKGICIKVLNLATIKPLDEKEIIALSKDVSGIVTVENHQIIGGVGSAIAELLSKKSPNRIEMVGVDDKFGQSGTPEELLKYYGLNSDSIKKKVLELLN